MTCSKDFHAWIGSDVSVKYVQGAENLEGFLTLLVLTPFSLKDILDKLPSLLNCRISSVQVTIVTVGLVVVLQPLRPVDVAAFSVGMFCAYSFVVVGDVVGLAVIDAKQGLGCARP